jgi:putative transposase
MEYPFFGSRRMAVQLHVNRKRMQRLMRIAGIEALFPKPNLSRPAPGHQIYPYLLRGVVIERPDQVWSTDITYIPMRDGFLYLAAVMDWFSRFVLSWELSNTMETGFCLAALDAAFRSGKPDLDNVFIERLWRSLKYELIYPGDFMDGAALRTALDGYFDFYNHDRPHQALKYKTPADLYRDRATRKKPLS